MLRLVTLGRLQLIRDGPRGEPIHVQPKRLALLVYLALAARDGFQHRDTLLALFWPRASEPHARRCLRQALFHLRNVLGDGVIVNAGKEGIALVPDRLWCDVVAMEKALRAGRGREALRLYEGDFLPGVFVDECSGELEEWVQRLRERLRTQLTTGAWVLVEEDLREGRPAAALETARRARGLSPDDERGLRRHMALLARVGDRAAALVAYAEFTRRLREEFDAEPSPESRQLYHAVKLGLALPEEPPTGPPRLQIAVQAPYAGSAVPRRNKARGSTWAAGIACFAALVLAGSAHDGGVPRRSAPTTARHLVVAQFTNHTRDSLLGAAVTEALRADLSEIAVVRVPGTGLDRAPLAGSLSDVEAMAVVTGDVAALGPGFRVSARLLSARSGRVLAVLRENAADSNYLLRAVERLSRRLRANVTESLAPAFEDAKRARLSTAYW